MVAAKAKGLAKGCDLCPLTEPSTETCCLSQRPTILVEEVHFEQGSPDAIADGADLFNSGETNIGKYRKGQES